MGLRETFRPLQNRGKRVNDPILIFLEKTGNVHSGDCAIYKVGEIYKRGGRTGLSSSIASYRTQENKVITANNQ